MLDDPLPSVRVEVDSLGSGSGPTASSLESPGSGRSTRRIPLLAAAGALLIFAVVAIALSGGDGGQAAAESDCRLDTTQTPTAQTSTSGPSRDGTASKPIEVERVTSMSDLASVVCDDQGYLALTNTTSPDSAGLFRSVDGLEWTAVDGVTIDGTIVGAVDFVVAGEFAVDRFFGLVRNGAGYSMFFQPIARGSDTPMTRRLVSGDAVSWVVDAEFPVETAIDGRGAPKFNADFALLATFDGLASSMIKDLLTNQLVDPTSLPELICSAELTTDGDPSFLVDPCDEGDSLVLPAGAFVAPGRMEQVGECAGVMRRFTNPTGFAVYDAESDRSRTVSVRERFDLLPSLFADGSTAALDVTHSVLTQEDFREGGDLAALCEGLVELTIPDCDLVVHSTFDAQVHLGDRPRGLIDLNTFNGTGFSTTLEREFVVILGTQVWAVDVDDSLLWRRIDIDLPQFFDSEFVELVPVQGQPGRLAWYGNSQVGIINLVEETSIVEDRDFATSFVDVIYADETYMFIQRGSSPVRIAMPLNN